MKGLTLRHPWAFAIQRLGKDVENRTWEPPRHLIGQYIAIHGGALPRDKAASECAEDARHIQNRFYKSAYLETLPDGTQRWLRENGEVLKVGDWFVPGIVAVAKLERVVFDSDNPWFCGPFGWVLADVTPLERPVPHRGALGFWQVEPHAEAFLRDAYAQAHDGEVMP